MRKISAVFLILLLSACGYGQDDLAGWEEDLEFYSQQLAKSHIALFHTLRKDEFGVEIARIKTDIRHKNEDEILVDLMRLTRKINDGHTSFPLWGREFATFPVSLKLVGGELRVVSTSTQYKSVLGAKLISVNGAHPLDIFKQMSEIAPFTENEFSKAVRAASYFTNVNLLRGLGVIENVDEAVFVFDVGNETKELKLKSSKSPPLEAQISPLNDKIFHAHEKVNDNLWYGSSPDKKTVYVKFKRYPSLSDMEKFAKDLLHFIDDNKSENLVIDLRDNYGGDFFVGLKLAQFLVLADTINWRSGVYTLIDNVTFSAAMSNAAQFSQLLNSRLVGSPTGARPSGYQDMGQFTLPNSKLTVTYSKRLYHFKEDKRVALYPDVHVEPSIDDYLNGYDRALRWIMDDINENEPTTTPAKIR